MTNIVGHRPDPAPDQPKRSVSGISNRAREEAAARMVGQHRPEPPPEDLPRAA
jgi:hypothetical protein